jgi:4-hydroxy-2-oxoheptanedioate aldolase
LQTNTAKARLKAGETIAGLFIRYPEAGLVEMACYQPWDFVVLDGEHGTLEPRDCEHMVRAAEVRGVAPLVRVPTNAPPIILRLLDTGALGVHVPWVNSGAEAEAAVSAVKYHPRGNRGLAGVRAAGYGQAGSFAQYVQQANAETMVVLHIETAEAVERLPEIVAVDGVDVIFIGPTDLSQSYGVPGQTDHPSVQRAIDRIVEVVAGSPAALGAMVGNAAAARQWRERGARYLAIGLEALVGPSAREFLRGARE